MGAWIEISSSFCNGNSFESHPSWVRGLKVHVSNILEKPEVQGRTQATFYKHNLVQL